MNLFKQYQISVTELESLLDERIEKLIQIKIDIEDSFRRTEGLSRDEYMKRIFKNAMSFHHGLQNITTLIRKDFSRAEVMSNGLGALPYQLGVEDTMFIEGLIKKYALRQLRVVSIINSLADSIGERFDEAIRHA